MNAWRVALTLLGVQCLWPLLCLAAPTTNQALEVLRAESTCKIADPETLFTAPLLGDLARFQIAAKHQPAQHLVEESEDYITLDYLVVRSIRLAGKYDLADVYRAKCSTSQAWRQAMAQLKPGEIFVVENYAWVALLAEGEYFGAGLSFIKQDERWRFNGIASDYLGSSPRVDALMRLLHTEFELPEVHVSQCRMPEAPELSEQLLAEKIDALETQEAQDADDYYDERDALAVAMRNAVRFYAEGKQTPPLPIAQMMMAEMLLRSLDFDDAPDSGTQKWAARVQRAARFMDDAEARGVNLDRVAPLLGWLGQAYWHGVGELSADSMRAKRYLELAAHWGDEQAAEFLGASQTHERFEPDALPRSNKEFTATIPKEIVRCQ